MRVSQWIVLPFLSSYHPVPLSSCPPVLLSSCPSFILSVCPPVLLSSCLPDLLFSCPPATSNEIQENLLPNLFQQLQCILLRTCPTFLTSQVLYQIKVKGSIIISTILQEGSVKTAFNTQKVYTGFTPTPIFIFEKFLLILFRPFSHFGAHPPLPISTFIKKKIIILKLVVCS